MTLRTDDELDEALATLAESEGISKQEVVRRAVLEKLARSERRGRVDAIAQQVMADYADALDRLGKS
ncbi:CopG family transcriptional regulator [Nocardioides sp. DS6]|uniref:CopG family transcriptional regulator n=1 Tax=Nocardioides eburneus TaxID=3231482 RepID=A0ABV3T172_9ACTN